MKKVNICEINLNFHSQQKSQFLQIYKVNSQIHKPNYNNNKIFKFKE